MKIHENSSTMATFLKLPRNREDTINNLLLQISEEISCRYLNKKELDNDNTNPYPRQAKHRIASPE